MQEADSAGPPMAGDVKTGKEARCFATSNHLDKPSFKKAAKMVRIW